MLQSRPNRFGELNHVPSEELREVVVEAINASNPDLLALVDSVFIGLEFIELVENLRPTNPQLTLNKHKFFWSARAATGAAGS